MAKITRAASGTRHVRWGLEILAALDAHHEVNYQLTSVQRDALATERQRIEPRIAALTAAVGPYRAFVDQSHVGIRAKQRVANYLCDEAQRSAEGMLKPHRKEIATVVPGGYASILSQWPLSRVLRVGHEKTAQLAETAASMIRVLPAKIPGTEPLADELERAASLLRDYISEGETIEKQRAPLRAAVQKAIYELREELDQMDGRLRSHFSAHFIDSLYPELARRGTAVADENDEDDDTSEAVEP